MRIGLGYIEVYKKVKRESYVCGQYVRARNVAEAELLIGESKNTGFTRTLDLVAQTPYGDLPAYLALGTGTQPKLPSDPYLSVEIMRIARSQKVTLASGYDINAPPQYWWVREHTYTITPSSNITVSEWGVSESGTAGAPLVAGGLFPSPISLAANETYSFKYKTMSEFVSSSNGRGYRGGLDPGVFVEAFLTGATQVTYNSQIYNLRAESRIYTTPTFAPYVPGSYRRSCSFDVSESYGFMLYYVGPGGIGMGAISIYEYQHPSYYPYYNTTRTVYVQWAPTSDF